LTQKGARTGPRKGASFVIASVGLVWALIAAVGGAAAAEVECAPAHAASTASGAVQAFYDVLAGPDEGAFEAAAAADFKAFDGGAQFDRSSLFKLIRAAAAQGKHFHWTVQDAVASIDCKTAFVRWVNRGWVDDATGRTDRTWLESALLRWEGGAWRIAFLHSTPVKR
jgi:hypothetical protein